MTRLLPLLLAFSVHASALATQSSPVATPRLSSSELALSTHPWQSSAAGNQGGTLMKQLRAANLADLTGDWRIAHLRVAGKTVTSVARAALTFNLGQDVQSLRLSGTAGCNRLNSQGSWQGGVLTFGPVSATRMLCPEMHAEQALVKLLASPLTVSRESSGTMTLRSTAANGSQDELVLSRRIGSGALPGHGPVPAPADPGLQTTSPDLLSGWTFALQSINGETPAIRGITLSFQRGQLSGKDGCNRYFGPYTLAGDQLQPGQIGSTQMACPDQPSSPDIERFLAQQPRVALRGNLLTLTAGGESWLFARTAVPLQK